MQASQKYSSINDSAKSYFADLALQRYRLEIDSDLDLSEMCKKLGVNERFVTQLVKVFENSETLDKEVFARFSVPVIVDYLRRTHQLYLSKKLPEIEQSIDHLVYGYHYYQPYLVAIKALFTRYKQNLVEHMRVEEQEFFPHALYLYDRHYRGGCVNKLHDKLVKYSVKNFLNHHDDTETELVLIRQTIAKYKPTQVEESLYRLLNSQINSFVHDLEVHAMIEDEILVPKVVKLEDKAIGNQLNFRLRVGQRP